MNAAQQMLARGATILAKQSGQAERFTVGIGGNETVWANCNRIPQSNDPQGVNGVSTEEGSVIWFPLNTQTVPERGTILVDSFGHQHSVDRAQHLGTQLQLTCTVTRP